MVGDHCGQKTNDQRRGEVDVNKSKRSVKAESSTFHTVSLAIPLPCLVHGLSYPSQIGISISLRVIDSCEDHSMLSKFPIAVL